MKLDEKRDAVYTCMTTAHLKAPAARRSLTVKVLFFCPETY